MLVPVFSFGQPLKKEKKPPESTSEQKEQDYFRPDADSSEEPMIFGFEQDLEEIENLEKQIDAEEELLIDELVVTPEFTDEELNNAVLSPEVLEEQGSSFMSLPWYSLSIKLWTMTAIRDALLKKKQSNDYLKELGLKNGMDPMTIPIATDYIAMAGLAYVSVKGNQGKFGIHKIKTNRARLMKYYDHWKAKAKLSKKLEKKSAKILKKYPAKIAKQKTVLNQLFAKHKIPQKVNGQISIAVPNNASFKLRWEIRKYNKLTKIFRQAKMSQKTIQTVNEKNLRIKKKISKKMTGRIVGYSTNVMRFFLKYGGIAALGTAFYVLWNDKNDKVILEVAPEHIPMIEEWITSLSEEIAITQLKLNTLEREDVILRNGSKIEVFE